MAAEIRNLPEGGIWEVRQTRGRRRASRFYTTKGGLDTALAEIRRLANDPNEGKHPRNVRVYHSPLVMTRMPELEKGLPT